MGHLSASQAEALKRRILAANQRRQATVLNLPAVGSLCYPKARGYPLQGSCLDPEQQLRPPPPVAFDLPPCASRGSHTPLPLQSSMGPFPSSLYPLPRPGLRCFPPDARDAFQRTEMPVRGAGQAGACLPAAPSASADPKSPPPNLRPLQKRHLSLGGRGTSNKGGEGGEKGRLQSDLPATADVEECERHAAAQRP